MVRVYGKENRRKTVDEIYCEQYALHAAVQDGNLMLVKSLCEQDGNFYPLDDSNKIRSSTGLTVDWFTPIGPLSISLAHPISKVETDKTETFKFNLGTTF